MNQWYFTIGIWLILFMLLIGIIIGIFLFIVHKVRKHNNKAIAVSIGINFALLVVVILYALSHSTYYRYNDWAILQSNIHMVKQRYGEFDLGIILTVCANGKEKTIEAVSIACTYKSEDEKGQMFLTTCKVIETILTENEEWKELPEYEFLYE